MSDLSVDSVEAWQGDVQDEGMSHNSANKCLIQLQNIMAYGVSRKVISSNPIADAKPLPTCTVRVPYMFRTRTVRVPYAYRTCSVRAG